MSLLLRVRNLARKLTGSKSAPDTEHLADAAERLEEVRGDNVTRLPADRGTSSMDNAAAAAKDYGLSRFSGETDAMGKTGGSYRAAKKRRDRKDGY
jgi:hypothetical protein